MTEGLTSIETDIPALVKIDPIMNFPVNLSEFEKEIITLLSLTNREGIDDLIEHMKKIGYFTAPAASRHHLHEEGGLMIHSYIVMRIMLAKNEMLGLGLDEETIILTGLLHDLCKCELYYRNDDDKWEKNKEILANGHAKYSLEIINKFIELTDDERRMIRLHMGVFGMYDFEGAKKGEFLEYDAQHMFWTTVKCKYVQVFASSDMEATFYENDIMIEDDMAYKEL